MIPEVDENETLDVSREQDLEQWGRRLGVPKEELRRAAERAGPRLGDIRQYLIGGFTDAGPTS